jgi:hypothetical protein
MPVYSYIYSLPYLGVFSLLFINSIPLELKKSVNRGGQLLASFAIVMLFFGLRGFVFTDYLAYYRQYYDCPSLFDGTAKISYFLFKKYAAIEKGFLLFEIVCKTISENYFFFQFASCLIDFLLLFSCLKYYIPNYIPLGIALYYCFGGWNLEFNLMRNSKAILLFLFSLRYIEKKQIIKYIIVNALGVLFHATAIIVLPLYFILNKKISRKLVLFIFIAGNIIYLFQIHWFRPILEYLGQLLFGGKIKMLILGYLASEMSAPYGITIGYIERTLSFCLIFYVSKRLTSGDVYNRFKTIFENSYYYYTFFFLFFSEIGVITSRFPLYFIFSYWIFYPYFYTRLSRNRKCIFLFLLLLYGVMKTYYASHHIIADYENVLFNHRTYNESRLMAEKYYHLLDVK